jgi:CMP/dCMP kinase
MIITIDGPAGSGKSTIARLLAKNLGFDYFDTGAMYRCFTWFLIKHNIDPDVEEDTKKILENFSFEIINESGKKKYFVKNEEVTDAIRTTEVTSLVSIVSAKKYVRSSLVEKQRAAAEGKNIVYEGRDMGTVVFPNADIKFFLTADSCIRAKRRLKEYQEKFPEKGISLEKILEDIEKRDKLDTTRQHSPLKRAEDAYIIDTGNLTIEEVTCKILKKVKKFFFSRMKFGYRICLKSANFFLKLFYKTKVYGLHNLQSGAALITSNHVSFLDPLVVSTSCFEEIHFLARESLFKNFLLKPLITMLNTHPVSTNEANLRTFKMIASLLKEGKKILMFPEGTRSKENEIEEVLPGVAFFVNFSKCAIIPTYIHGTYEIWPRKRKFPKLSGSIDCIFGTPINFCEFESLAKKERIESITKCIKESLQNLKKWAEEGCIGFPP